MTTNESAKASLDRIRDARRYRKKSQAEIAGLLNIGQSAYARIEIGTAPLTLERALDIMTILSIDFMYLFAESSSPADFDLLAPAPPYRKAEALLRSLTEEELHSAVAYLSYLKSGSK